MLRAWTPLRTPAQSLAAILVAAAVVGCAGAPAPAPTASVPMTIDLPALKPLGDLAVVDKGRLHVALADAATLLEVTGPDAGSTVTAPAWSADGQWLAYLAIRGSRGSGGELHIVRVRGARETYAFKELTEPLYPGEFAWSPTANVLAITPHGEQGRHGLWLATTDGKARLHTADGLLVYRALWSPDGSTLAYVSTRPAVSPELRSDMLWTIAASGTGEPSERFMADRTGIALGAWWRDGKGLLYWLQPSHSASLAADGVTLFSRSLATGIVSAVGTTLMYRDWLALSPDGTQIVIVEGAGREIWSRKSLALCTIPAGTCAAIARPQDTVALDPAFSPTGDQIAYVLAAERMDGAMVPNYARTWGSTRSLWVSAPDGAGARQIAGGGAAAPLWSADGTHLVFVRDNRLWSIAATGGDPVPLTGTLAPYIEQSFYGYVSWGETIAWYRR